MTVEILCFYLVPIGAFVCQGAGRLKSTRS